jgi:hypothetical protein
LAGRVLQRLVERERAVLDDCLDSREAGRFISRHVARVGVAQRAKQRQADE